MTVKDENLWSKVITIIERKSYALVLTALIAILGLLIILNPYRINHDCAAHLTNAQSMLEGRILYIDIADFNPPLIYYLNLIPNLIARPLSLNVIQVFNFIILLLIIWSTYSLHRMSRRLQPQSAHAGPEILALFWVLSAFYIWKIMDFGQRDHLFVLLFIPFFVTRWVRWEGGKISRREAITNGIAGAIGVCLKPFFLLPAFAPEIYWSISKRSIRNFFKPEFYAFAATGLAYALHFFFLPIAVKNAYFVEMMSFATKGYDVYNSPLSRILQIQLRFPFMDLQLIDFTLVLTVIPFLVEPFSKTSLWRLSRPLALMTLTSLIIFLVQHKGWTYHAVPMMHGVFLLIALIVSEGNLFVSRNIEQAAGAFRLKINRYQVSLIVLVLCVYWGGNLVQQGVVPLPDTQIRRIISRYSKPGDSVLFISTSTGANFPILLQMDRRQGTRFPNHFPIPFLHAIGKKNPKMALQEEKRFLREMSDDLKKFRPRVIFIDDDGWNQAMPRGFVITQYLTTNGFIANAMKEYTRLSNIIESRNSEYAVFVLKEGST